VSSVPRGNGVGHPALTPWTSRCRAPVIYKRYCQGLYCLTSYLFVAPQMSESSLLSRRPWKSTDHLLSPVPFACPSAVDCWHLRASRQAVNSSNERYGNILSYSAEWMASEPLSREPQPCELSWSATPKKRQLAVHAPKGPEKNFEAAIHNLKQA
jgi:hypothetical protein